MEEPGHWADMIYSAASMQQVPPVVLGCSCFVLALDLLLKAGAPHEEDKIRTLESVYVASLLGDDPAVIETLFWAAEKFHGTLSYFALLDEEDLRPAAQEVLGIAFDILTDHTNGPAAKDALSVEVAAWLGSVVSSSTKTVISKPN